MQKYRKEKRGLLAKWLSWFLVFILTFCFTVNWGLGLTIDYGSYGPPPLELQEWQLKGIIAALGDLNPQIQILALEKLSEYKTDELKISQSEYKKIADFLSNDNLPSEQKAAAEALGKMGTTASSEAPLLLKLLKNSNDTNVQLAAARALEGMGAAASSEAPRLGALLNNYIDTKVQSAIAYALGEMGAAAASQTPLLLKLLENSSDTDVQFAAAYALGEMGATTQLLQLLENSSDTKVQSAIIYALGEIGSAAKDYAPRLGELLDTDDTNVKLAAVRALGKMGEAGASEAHRLGELLDIDDEYLQSVAVEALGEMGAAAKDYAPRLGELLGTDDLSLQEVAARALGKMGEAGASEATRLGKLLDNTTVDISVKRAVVYSLGQMGEAAVSEVPQLLKLLEIPSNLSMRQEVVYALGQMGEANTETILSLLNTAYENRWQRSSSHFLAYFLSGAKKESIILIQWLGSRKEYPDLTQLDRNQEKKIWNRDQAITILRVFDKIWEPCKSFNGLRDDLSKQIAKVIKQGKWKFQDIGLLTKHYHNLQSVNSTHADAVKAKITQLEGWKWFFAAWRIWLAHFLFWLLLIFAYPRSSAIQAIFFWNPWVRRIIGFGYVGFLITWIPFLRSKLLIPFKKSLLADAKLDYSDLHSYFDKSLVKQEASGEIKQLKEAIPTIKGQIILQGESGLGKSLFLRQLAKNSQRIVVYLSADRCTNGVIEAIQNKILGKAKDFNFLRDLIYSGAIDICLDGLNEVNADTRANIKKFVEEYFKGNIIMTTQPLEWKLPATASIYILEPLPNDLIREFLLSRQSYLAEENQLQTQDYEQVCHNYLAKALNQNLPSEESAATKNILSNPMDLTILSQIIASGEEPDLFRLQEQQYELMAVDYEKKQHEKFPLAKFSEQAYQMRLNNSTISETDFLAELQCMLRHKMVICQQFRNVQGENVQEWKFRHDKIWEFFILQSFLGQNNELPNQHKNDPRFRGVYFLLANLLPLAEAENLREDLIQYAADSGDHSVSDQFIQILRSRKNRQKIVG